jgi:hypothetical protein
VAARARVPRTPGRANLKGPRLSVPVPRLFTVDSNTLLSVGGLVTGVIGGGAGVWGVLYAHRALGAAEKSTTIAGEANTLARESNAIAADARELAKDANKYSHRAEARETERHDVRWDDGWLSKTRGMYAITKRGDDPARKVRATVSFDGQEQSLTVEVLKEEGAQLHFEFPSAAAAYAEERAELRAHNIAVSSDETYGPLNIGMPKHHETAYGLEAFSL